MTTSETYKIVISGPVGAGKSTAIAALSDIPPVATDAIPSDDVGKIKNTTTVAMDYGVINLEDGNKIHLYGTPGQQRFEFMWDIMLNGAIGLILLINNNTPDPMGDFEKFLTYFSKALESVPFCVGVTHLDESQTFILPDYHAVLKEKGHIIPLFSVDARSSQDMNTLLMAMLGMIEPEILIRNVSALGQTGAARG